MFFTSCILGIIDLHAPLKTLRVSKSRAPCLKYPIKVMLKERENAHGEYLLSSIRREKAAFIKDLQKHINSQKNSV